MRDKEKALAVLDDLVEELHLPVTLHAGMAANGNDPDEEPWPEYNIEIRPYAVDHIQMSTILSVLERHDLELYWYSFNQTGHMRIVEPGEISS